MTHAFLCLAVIAAPPVAPKGLDAGGGNVFKTAAFEAKVLEQLNVGRGTDAKKPTFTADDGLRNFARRYAQLAATQQAAAQQIETDLKQQKLAPRGYRYQYAAGNDPVAIVKQIKIDFDLPAKAGIGAYLVPAKEPYYQVLVLLVLEPDPMEGKVGLTPAQTDPVMKQAAERIKSNCYDLALKRNPNLMGELVLQVVIADKGEVKEVKTLQGLEAEFDTCAAIQVRSLRFPEPYKGKPVTLNHPMRFTPPQGEKFIGWLSQAQIDATFGSASQDFRACYDKERKQKPSLAGTLGLSIDVNAGGGVDNVVVTSNETGSATLSGCVVKRAYDLHFPPPRYNAGLTLTYPLRFVPDK
ncbi:MAG: AgmX/PglI C-terminal domain-containing protein [Myxococcota bacterium]|nr:AgmX/PglI C-terminal domain-containing protein [Myxococcota bacterium]